MMMDTGKDWINKTYKGSKGKINAFWAFFIKKLFSYRVNFLGVIIL